MIAPHSTSTQTSSSNGTPVRAIVGATIAGAGTVAGTAALMKHASMPGVVAGGVALTVAGTIAAPSLLNMRSSDNPLWKSAIAGAAAPAVVGGLLGALSSGHGTSGAAKTMMGGGAMGALTFGLMGAALATGAHFATKQH